MSLKLEMFKVFQTVAEEGSLAAAAARLHRSISAISMTLSQFETHLGAPLFETDRKNRLTPLGQHVLDECKRTNEYFARAVTSIESRAKNNAGRVRLAVVPSATVSVLPNVIARFQAEFPNTHLEIRDMDSATVRSSIAQNDADIGIVSALPTPSAPVKDTVIYNDSLGIIARRDGACAASVRERWGRCHWSDLRRERVIQNPLTELVMPLISAPINDTSVLDVRNTMTLLSFVQAGLGVTVLPKTSLIGAWGDLTFLHPTDPPITRALCKIRTQRNTADATIDAFWDMLVEV